LHRGEREAADATALMRSRFSAFALGEPAYLWRTLHPDHEDRQRPEPEVLAELREGIATFRYMGLAVLDHDGPDAEGVARVLFVARVFARGRDRSFIERSEFAHDGVGWRYLTGTNVLLERWGRPVEGLTLATFAPG
jgi:SEC-C motif-containing protein